MPAKVLVVEDNTDLLYLYKTALGQRGYQVREAHSANKVIAILTSEDYIPDLVFLDIEMPDGTGTLVIDYMRERPQYQACKIIVITANDKYRVKLADMVEEFLVKPIAIAHLMDLADRYLKGVE
jgi:CheY-like chemotaxis protein